MRPAHAGPRAVVSAWAAVSPFGVPTRAFTDGVRGGGSALTEMPAPEHGGHRPAHRAAPVPDFDIRAVLGRKGTRSLDRVSALALAAVADLRARGDRVGAVTSGPGAALVLGTTAGSARSMMLMTRDTLTQPKPYFIDTATIPNGIMNSAAAQCAIRHGLQGPNTTIAGGRSAALLALRYAVGLLSAGRAGAVLCGGSEELSPERTWLAYHASGGRAVELGEGCAMLLVEPAHSAHGGLAEVLLVRSRVHTGGSLAASAADLVARSLRDAGVTPGEIWALSPSGRPEADAAVRALVTGTDRTPPLDLPGDETWGDAGAGGSAFQLASALARAGGDPAAAGRVAVVISYDPEGVLCCALLRMIQADGGTDHD